MLAEGKNDFSKTWTELWTPDWNEAYYLFDAIPSTPAIENTFYLSICAYFFMYVQSTYFQEGFLHNLLQSKEKVN